MPGGPVETGGPDTSLRAGIGFENPTLILLCSGWIAVLAMLADGVVGPPEGGVPGGGGGEMADPFAAIEGVCLSPLPT
ncbi:MAG TPA: hypothetical protein PLY91_03935 [Methanoregulaceae archaeon]|nr:hypothetical protein [Methanoregulaceae archaeon]HQJ87675.1 hypothetical protein [Methanoregulaceae archaeon]